MKNNINNSFEKEYPDNSSLNFPFREVRRNKYIIILGDGMADEPIASIGNKTPLQAANTPNIDKLAKMGRCGMLDTIHRGFAPGS